MKRLLQALKHTLWGYKNLSRIFFGTSNLVDDSIKKSIVSGEYKYPQTVDINLCIGCGVCANVCPMKCIKMKPLGEKVEIRPGGFKDKYPELTEGMCCFCYQCHDSCPVYTVHKKDAAINPRGVRITGITARDLFKPMWDAQKEKEKQQAQETPQPSEEEPKTEDAKTEQTPEKEEPEAAETGEVKASETEQVTGATQDTQEGVSQDDVQETIPPGEEEPVQDIIQPGGEEPDQEAVQPEGSGQETHAEPMEQQPSKLEGILGEMTQQKMEAEKQVGEDAMQEPVGQQDGEDQQVSQEEEAPEQVSQPVQEEVPAGNGLQTVDADLCIGCGVCASVCPMGCIEMIDAGEQIDLKEGMVKEKLPKIDLEKCVKCMMCHNSCLMMKEYGKPSAINPHGLTPSGLNAKDVVNEGGG